MSETPESPLNRLARIRAEAEAINTARTSAPPPIEEQIAQAERELADAKALAAAVCDHGPLGKAIAQIDTDLGVVIVKKPHHVAFRRFQDKGDYDSAANEALVLPCLVYPSAARFDEIIKELPATLTRCSDAVVVLAGFRAKAVGGK